MIGIMPVCNRFVGWSRRARCLFFAHRRISLSVVWRRTLRVCKHFISWACPMPLASGMTLPNTFLCKCERQIAKILIVWCFCTNGYATFLISFGTTIGDLWAFGGFLYTCLYNNGVKIFGAEGVLCRRLENVESKMGHTTRESICITRVSA